MYVQNTRIILYIFMILLVKTYIHACKIINATLNYKC